MFRIKAMLALLLALGLPMLLTSCDSSASQPAVSQPTATPPTSSQATAIKLAKAAAAKLKSPPRIYMVGSSYVRDWPDVPGAVATTYAVCGAQPAAPSGDYGGGGYGGAADPCQKPMTLTTELAPASDGSSENVTFRASWQPDATHSSEHSWQFRVGADQQVTFIREEGDALPPMVM